MNCYLCENKIFKLIHKGVRDNKNINVIRCENCGLVTLDDFSQISDTHYQDGKMHLTIKSIDDWLIETERDDNRRYLSLKEKINGKNVLDFGTGNGGFLQKIKKTANKSIGIELENRIIEYYKNSEIIIYNSIENLLKKEKNEFDLITSFHVFEHLKDPAYYLKELSKIINIKGEIIIEVPSATDALLTLYENKNFADFTYWSQHLFLFDANTVELLVKKSKLKLNWIKQIQRYGLSNHLYWLSKDKPGGHNVWEYLNNNKLDELYSNQLASINKCDTILFSVSK